MLSFNANLTIGDILFMLTVSFYSEESEEEQLSSPELGRRSRHTSESSVISNSKADLSRKPSLALDRQASAINDTYLHFVSTLLKECKTKVSHRDNVQRKFEQI